MLSLGGTFNINRENNKNDINNKIKDDKTPFATLIPSFVK